MSVLLKQRPIAKTAQPLEDQLFAANGYFVFDTNFRSSTGYGEAFKWATWGAWGTKDGQVLVCDIAEVDRFLRAEGYRR